MYAILKKLFQNYWEKKQDDFWVLIGIKKIGLRTQGKLWHS
jgi:hypothetical protein